MTHGSDVLLGFRRLWRRTGTMFLYVIKNADRFVDLCNHSHMEDFPALIHSLGEHAVSYIGRDLLRGLVVAGDPDNGSAEVEILLEDNTWENQSHAVDRMIELRTMFLDEISISYSFSSGEMVNDSEARHAASNYCFA